MNSVRKDDVEQSAKNRVLDVQRAPGEQAEVVLSIPVHVLVQHKARAPTATSMKLSHSCSRQKPVLAIDHGKRQQELALHSRQH